MERLAHQGFEPLFVATRRYQDNDTFIIKNKADFRLVCDGMELLNSSSHSDCFVVVSGDAALDAFLEKAGACGKKIIRVAVKGSEAAHSSVLGVEKYFYDDWVSGLSQDPKDSKIEEALKNFQTAVSVIRSWGKIATLNLVKEKMRSFDPAFEEENLQIPTFRHFAYLGERKGLVRIDATKGEPATAYGGDTDKTEDGVFLGSGNLWKDFISKLGQGVSYSLTSFLRLARATGEDEKHELEKIWQVACSSGILWKKTKKTIGYKGNEESFNDWFLNIHNPRVQVYSLGSRNKK